MFTYESLYYVDMNGYMISCMYGGDPILGFIFSNGAFVRKRIHSLWAALQVW